MLNILSNISIYICINKKKTPPTPFHYTHTSSIFLLWQKFPERNSRKTRYQPGEFYKKKWKIRRVNNFWSCKTEGTLQPTKGAKKRNIYIHLCMYGCMHCVNIKGIVATVFANLIKLQILPGNHTLTNKQSMHSCAYSAARN